MATIRLKRGTTTPSGLTLAEPAFDYANNKLFVGVTASSVWVGGEVDNNTALGTSQVKIPTQYAVKTYVDNNIAGGSVTTVNGLTGALVIGGGNGISVSAANKGITVTNTGVLSVNTQTGAITNVAFTNAVNTFTLGNIFNAGVTTSDLTVTNAATVGGNLSVTGNLTVNGTTTYVNSTVTEIADPIITLGWTGGVGGMPTDDNKDRGVAFKYNSSGGKTGFFGYDDSTGYFTFVPTATISGEVVSGTVGTANFNGVISTSGTALTLTGNAANPATITITGHPSVAGSEAISLNAGTVSVNNASGAGVLRINDSGSNFDAILTVGSYPTSDRTFTFPDHTGTVVAPTNLGTSGYILKANGTTSQPTWIDANAAGFTAYAAQEVVGGAAGNLLYQSAANVTAFVTNAGITGSVLTYNTTSNTPLFANPNTSGFTAFAATNIGGGAAGSLPYNTANTATTFLSIGTSGFVLTSTGSAPQWSDLTGLTAGTAQTVTVASDTADTTCFVTFVNAGTNSNQAMKYNTSLTYNATTNYLEANIDGGAY